MQRNSAEAQCIRVTVAIPIAVHQNLTLYCGSKGISKSYLIQELLMEKLKGEGYQPDKLPKEVKVTY